MLLNPEDLQQFQNHSSQMAALDFMVSLASDTFVPTYDGNMARVVEGHRRYQWWILFILVDLPRNYLNKYSPFDLCRYLGFKKTFQLDRRTLVELLDLHENGTLSWDEFSASVRLSHEKRMGQPSLRMVIADKPKEEEYFYANPQECLCDDMSCTGNTTVFQ